MKTGAQCRNLFTNFVRLKFSLNPLSHFAQPSFIVSEKARCPIGWVHQSMFLCCRRRCRTAAARSEAVMLETRLSSRHYSLSFLLFQLHTSHTLSVSVSLTPSLSLYPSHNTQILSNQLIANLINVVNTNPAYSPSNPSSTTTITPTTLTIPPSIHPHISHKTIHTSKMPNPRAIFNRLFPPSPPPDTTTWQSVDPLPSTKLSHPRVRTCFTSPPHPPPLSPHFPTKPSLIQIANIPPLPTRPHPPQLRRHLPPAAAIILDPQLALGSDQGRSAVSADLHARWPGMGQ